jgi:hypothetical protein
MLTKCLGLRDLTVPAVRLRLFPFEHLQRLAIRLSSETAQEEPAGSVLLVRNSEPHRRLLALKSHVFERSRAVKH